MKIIIIYLYNILFLVCGSGSARLLDQDNVVNNRNYNEIGLAQVVGVVEVCHNGEWASVCDTGISESINPNFANQVCVTLKYTCECLK